MSDFEERRTRDDLSILDILYVGFNSRVIALHRDTGEVLWDWKSPRGSGFVAVMVDGDRVIASVHGYMYCLDPITGEQWWSNPLSGMGVGTPCLASIHGSSGSAAAAIIAQQHANSAATSGGMSGGTFG